jgi:mono/diheme cytochrome c family protein
MSIESFLKRLSLTTYQAERVRDKADHISKFTAITRPSRGRMIVGTVLHTQCFLRGAIASLVFIALPVCAFAADAAKGEIIAKRWCASCHLVAPEQTQAIADVPTFAAIARMKLPPGQLKAFLTDPHPKMPDMSLTRGETEDIVAYIRSLAP